MSAQKEKEITEEASAPSSFPPMSTGEGGDQYSVFLSFRGSDTRKGFADHLYNSLVNAGTKPISVFRDDESLKIGVDFGSEILDAITRSKISIPIISENYASSIWCLRELVKMMECKKSMSHMVLPIFYKVRPSDVRFLTGNFGSAFHLRKGRFDEKDIEEGTRALTKVSCLKGWESEEFANGREGELVKEVMETIFSNLRHDFQLDVTKDLVGVDHHVNRIMNWVYPSHSARMIGIYGMGGIGKTTLAKAIYNKLSNDFKDRSYLPDIRETAHQKGICHLQNQLISKILPNTREIFIVDDGISLIKSSFKGKKVLIILDDIDHQDQLNALARERDWFMSGSIIIVTTRYKAVLDQSKFKLDYQYELEGLGASDSLLLFKKHAFRVNCSLTDFESISHAIVSTTGGLPLALEVIGSYLYRKTKGVWEDVLEKLRKEPHGDVQSKLKLSYEALEPGQKEIFLDIACFFIGEPTQVAKYMWKECGFFPNQAIEELKLRCLIKIGYQGELRMHDQLRDLGRSIVCQEGPLERRSRIWNIKEASRVLQERKGTETIQAICLEQMPNTAEQFKNLHGLRFLRLRDEVARGGRRRPHLDLGGASGDFKELSSKLRWPRWFGDGLFIVPFGKTNLQLPKLVMLELSGDQITKDWRGWSSMTAAKSLKVLNLTECLKLTCTPDLSAFTKLEILILKYCRNLKQIHPSIGKLKNLVSLDLTKCSKLKEIPMSIGSLTKLEKLIAASCDSLRKIPNFGNFVSLQHLDLSNCPLLTNILSSIENLQNLQHLNIHQTALKRRQSHYRRGGFSAAALPTRESPIVALTVSPHRRRLAAPRRAVAALEWTPLPSRRAAVDPLAELPLTPSFRRAPRRLAELPSRRDAVDPLAILLSCRRRRATVSLSYR